MVWSAWVFLPAEAWVSWTKICWHTSNVNGFLAFLKHFGLTVEIIKLIQWIHLNRNYSEIRNGISCENHLSHFGAKSAQGHLCVLFSLIVQWCHSVPSEGSTEIAPHQGWGFSPEIHGRHNPTLCQVTPAGRVFGSGSARQCSGMGTLSRGLGMQAPDGTQESQISSCGTIISSLRTDAHLLLASLLQSLLSCFSSDYTSLTFHYSQAKFLCVIFLCMHWWEQRVHSNYAKYTL